MSSSFEPTYTTPLATAGDESTAFGGIVPVIAVHKGLQVLPAPVPEHWVLLPVASKARRLPPSEPTYTMPLATAGEDSTEPPVYDVRQIGAPVAASKA